MIDYGAFGSDAANAGTWIPTFGINTCLIAFAIRVNDAFRPTSGSDERIAEKSGSTSAQAILSGYLGVGVGAARIGIARILLSYGYAFC